MRRAIAVLAVLAASFTAKADARPSAVVGARRSVSMVVSVPRPLRTLRLVEVSGAVRDVAGRVLGVDAVEDDRVAVRECMSDAMIRHRFLCLHRAAWDEERPDERQLLLVVAVAGTDDGDGIAAILLDLRQAQKVIDEAQTVGVTDDDTVEAGVVQRAVLARAPHAFVRGAREAREHIARIIEGDLGAALREFGSANLTVRSDQRPVTLFVDDRRVTTITATDGVDLTGLTIGTHDVRLEGEDIVAVTRTVTVEFGDNQLAVNPELRHPPVHGWAYDALFYGGAGLAVAGTVVAIVAPADHSTLCVGAPDSPGCTFKARPLVAVGAGVGATGVAWAVQALLTRDETTFPYLQTLIGVGVGVLVGLLVQVPAVQ